MKLIYQAYGQQKIIHQSLFSICSLLHVWPEYEGEILVYSDQGAAVREFFKGEARVRVVDVTMEQIKQWGGEQDFVHRVKLEILLDATKYPSASSIYLDGDTIFNESPRDLFSSISKDISLMHVKEYELRAPLGPLPTKIARFVRGKEFQLGVGKKVVIPDSTSMWNAGLIGYARENESFLRTALQLTDALYGAYPKHVMEQLAVSYSLAEVSNILPADEVVQHYWASKEYYQVVIDQYLVKHRHCAEAVQLFPKIVEEDVPMPTKKSFGWLRRLKEKFSFPRPRQP